MRLYKISVVNINEVERGFCSQLEDSVCTLVKMKVSVVIINEVSVVSVP